MAHRSSPVTGSGLPLAAVIPALAGLVVLGLFIGLLNGPKTDPPADEPGTNTVVAGQPAGTVLPATSAAPTSSPTASPTIAPTEEPSPSETPVAAGSDGFSAEVAVCRSVRGSRCVGPFETMPRHAQSFWFVVDFQNAGRGDVIGSTLRGPGGSRDTPDFTVQGGDGHAWGQVSARGLKPGRYTLGIQRNGQPAAGVTFRVR